MNSPAVPAQQEGKLTLEKRWSVATKTIEELGKAQPGSGLHRAHLEHLSELVLPGVYEHYQSKSGGLRHFLALGVGRHMESGEYSVLCIALHPYPGRIEYCPVIGHGGFLTPQVVEGIEKERFRYLGPLKAGFDEFLRANIR